MIFGKLTYKGNYTKHHTTLLKILREHFQSTEAGLQGDSYVWVTDGNAKVSVDTFTSSITHEVKAKGQDAALAHQVLKVLKAHYEILEEDPPKLEAHE